MDINSREVTAFWGPDGELYQFTRLVMGTKNAATVSQNAYTDALNTKLNKRSYKNVANFADDFFAGANTIPELLQVFSDFLEMCEKAGITLNPEKIRFGFTQEQFYGYVISQGKIEPADKNLDPIRKMIYPRTRSQLR